MPDELIPGGEPHPPVPLQVSISLAELERLKPKPDGEAISEENFSEELERASKEANPGNETLRAMEK